MSTDKKFYFLKMPVDYILQNLELKKLRLVKNGDTYFVIYFKLLADALDSNGHIYYENDLDSYCEDFAILYGDKPLMIKNTILNCNRLGLIDLEPGHIFLNRTEELTTSENESTRRKRNQRARDRQRRIAEENENSEGVTPMSHDVTEERDTSVTHEDNVTLERDKNVTQEDNVTLERDNVTLKSDNVTRCHANKSKSKSKSKMSESESYVRVSKCRNKQNDSGSPDQDPDDRLTDHRLTDYKKVFDLFKRECPSLNTVVRISDKRKGILNEFAKAFTAEEITLGFRKAEKSKFLRGEVSDNGKPFRFVFEWFFKPENFNKVCEGRYDNRPGKIQIEESATDYAALEEELLAN